MPRWNRPWHGREDEIVQAYLDGWRTRRIYDEFQISNRALFDVLESKGVELRGFPSELKYDRAAIVADFVAGMSYEELQKKYNIPFRQSIAPMLRSAGIKSTRAGGPKPLSLKPWNADYFNGRTEDVAYWAGFLMADGSITNDGGNTYVLSLTLGEKDIEHLRAFCDVIGIDREFIKPQAMHYREKHYTMYRINVYHQSLPEMMKPWGIIPNKTYSHVPPEVSVDLLPAFLRGWADGDGSVAHSARGSWTFGVVGNRDGIDWYTNALRSIGYTGHIGSERPEGKAWSRLIVSGADNVRQVAKLLKTDDFCLRRKWDKVSKEDR
jgi:hypothetical protein